MTLIAEPDSPTAPDVVNGDFGGAVLSSDVYQPDHTSLLHSGKQKRGRAKPWMTLPRVDAIVIPAACGDRALLNAARAARAAAELLIVLCSKDCSASGVREYLRQQEPRVPILVIDLQDYPGVRPAQGLQLRGSLRWPADTARKRNIGLLIARRLGLRHVLFLDDDVSGLKGAWIRQAVQVVEQQDHLAAAWTFDDYPDNSAVSHVYRQWSGRFGPQTCFAGGGGLLVKIDDKVPHFPEGVYNEDWFFLFSLLMRGSVANMGSLRQQAYDPFARTGIAAVQEFGDVIAEHLMTECAALQRLGPVSRQRELMARSFWLKALSNRDKFLKILRDDVTSYSHPCRGRPAALEILASASAALSEIRLQDIKAWASSWSKDAARWDDIWKASAIQRSGILADDIRDVMASLRLAGHYELVLPGKLAFRYRIPETIRAFVPRRGKTALAWLFEQVHAEVRFASLLIRLAEWRCRHNMQRWAGIRTGAEAAVAGLLRSSGPAAGGCPAPSRW